jgi:hypothetical protein
MFRPVSVDANWFVFNAVCAPRFTLFQPVPAAGYHEVITECYFFSTCLPSGNAARASLCYLQLRVTAECGDAETLSLRRHSFAAWLYILL